MKLSILVLICVNNWLNRIKTLPTLEVISRILIQASCDKMFGYTRTQNFLSCFK